MGKAKLKKNREHYISLRRKYEPAKIKLVIVAESPPASGLYFYDPTGRTSEPLFSALMSQLNCSPDTKETGLKEFRRRGWLLVDATYEPVNHLKSRVRDEVILRNYPRLRDDLKGLIPNFSTALILIKANVCHLLEQRLVNDGFNVINCGQVVYFPSSGRQPAFHQQFSAIRKSVRI